MSDTNTIVTPADRRMVSAMSRRLSTALGERKIRIKHQTAQHLIARTCGFDNTHALFAAMEAAHSAAAPVASAAMPVATPTTPLAIRLFMDRHTCAFSVDAVGADAREGIEIVTTAAQLRDARSGVIRLYLVDTRAEAQLLDQRFEERRRSEGVVAYPVAIDGVHMVLAEHTDDDWSGDHPADVVEIVDQRSSLHRPVLIDFDPPDAPQRASIIADESSTGSDLIITDQILSMTADEIRSFVARNEGRYIEPGEGWPFDVMPEAVDHAMRAGGYACVALKEAVLKAFNVDEMKQITDEAVLALGRRDAILRRLVRMAGVPAGRISLDRASPDAIRVVIEGQDNHVSTATVCRDGTIRTNGGFPEAGEPKRLFAALDRCLLRKSPHPGSGYYARTIDAGLTAA